MLTLPLDLSQSTSLWMQHLIYLMTILSSLSTYKEKKINEPSATLSITWIKARQRYANWTRRHELNANLSEKERAQKDALLIQNNRVSHVSKMLRVFDWWPFKSWIWAVSFPNKCPNMFRKCWQYSIVGYPSDRIHSTRFTRDFSVYVGNSAIGDHPNLCRARATLSGDNIGQMSKRLVNLQI